MNTSTLNTQDGDLNSIPRLTTKQSLVSARLLFADVRKALHKLKREHGEIVATGKSNRAPVYALGAQWNEKVLLNSTGVFSSYQGWNFVLERIFPGSVMAMDGKEHMFQRRLMSQAFKKDKLVASLEQMNPLIDQIINEWPEGEVPIYPAIKSMTLDLAVPIFMGMELDHTAEKVNKAFCDTVAASMAAIRYPIPFTPMWYGVKGRKYLVNLFREKLPEKRKNKTPDFFSLFSHAETEEGEKFTDDQIIDHMIFLMMAAHDTTTSTLTTLFYALAKNPDWQERLRAQSQALNKSHLDYEDLEKLPEFEWVMNEALRLYPPLPLILRRATDNIACNNYQIEKGQLIVISPSYTHYDQSLWKDPESFDPERFSDQRQEQKVHRYAWIPFGGGAHMCIGQHFANLQVKAVLHQILLKYSWSVADDYKMPYQLMPIAKPKDNLPITLSRL